MGEGSKIRSSVRKVNSSVSVRICATRVNEIRGGSDLMRAYMSLGSVGFVMIVGVVFWGGLWRGVLLGLFRCFPCF